MSEFTEAFQRSISVLGFESDAVCCHASMRSFAQRPRAGEVINAMLAADITLMVPTFTYHYELPPPTDDQPRNNGMDYKRRWKGSNTPYVASENDLTLEAMGALPAAVLQRPERIRGYNPLDSFSAIGKLANSLVSAQSAEDVYAPFRALLKQNGKILMLGTDTTSLTFIHFAEQQAGRRLFIRWALAQDGEIRRVRVGGCSNGFGKLMPIVREVGNEAQCLGSTWIAADAKTLLARLVEAIKSDPMITHCGRMDCDRCNDAINGGPE